MNQKITQSARIAARIERGEEIRRKKKSCEKSESVTSVAENEIPESRILKQKGRFWMLRCALQVTRLLQWSGSYSGARRLHFADEREVRI